MTTTLRIARLLLQLATATVLFLPGSEAVADAPEFHPSSITAPPKVPTEAALDSILRRRMDSHVIGWYSENSTWEASTCQGNQVYSSSGRFGGCCEATDSLCSLATACASNIAVFPGGGFAVCEGGEQCGTATVRLSTTGSALQTMVHCVKTSDVVYRRSTLYRQTYELSTPTSTTPAAKEIQETTSTQTQETDVSDDGAALERSPWRAIAGAVAMGAILVA